MNSLLFHRVRRRAVRAAAAAGLAWACAAAGADTLHLALSRSPLSLPFYVAEAEGFFADEGVAVRSTECIGGHRCLKRVIDGSADLATATDTPVMFNSFSNTDFMVVATFVTSAQDLKLVARKDAGISQPGHLAGKRIGFVHGASSHYFLDTYLLVYGIDPKSVQLVALQPEQMPQALHRGEVDAVASWEPFGFMSLQQLGGGGIVLRASGVYTQTFNLVAHRRLAGKADRDLVRLLKALDRAQRLIRDRPAKAQAVLRKRLGVDQALVDWVWPQLHFRLSLDQGLLKTLESEARWAIRSGHATARTLPNYLDYLHPGPLLEVNPDAVGIAR